jgi:hypothetical protein
MLDTYNNFHFGMSNEITSPFIEYIQITSNYLPIAIITTCEITSCICEMMKYNPKTMRQVVIY